MSVLAKVNAVNLGVKGMSRKDCQIYSYQLFKFSTFLYNRLKSWWTQKYYKSTTTKSTTTAKVLQSGVKFILHDKLHHCCVDTWGVPSTCTFATSSSEE